MSGIVSGVISVVGKIIGSVFSVVGRVLGGLIPTPDTPQTTYDGNESATYGFGAMRNIASKDAPVPVIYGEHRFAGNVIYQEILPAIENNSMIERAITIAEGPIESVEKLKLNTMNWDEYTAPHKGWSYWLGEDAQTYDAPDGGSGEGHGTSRVKDPALTTEYDTVIPEQTA